MLSVAFAMTETWPMEIIVETFVPVGEASGASRRVRPLPGQGFRADMRVECSRKMRYDYPLGQRFRIAVTPTSRNGGVSFLYSNPRGPWQTVTAAEAARYIAETFRSRA